MALDDFDPLFQKYGAQAGLDPSLFKAIALTESSGNPGAVNPDSGAVGLMQFMPATAKQYGINPKDPEQSVAAAAQLLKANLAQSNGDLEGAVAAYGGAVSPDKREGYLNKVSTAYNALRAPPVVQQPAQAQAGDPVLAMLSSSANTAGTPGASTSAPADPVLAMLGTPAQTAPQLSPAAQPAAPAPSGFVQGLKDPLYAAAQLAAHVVPQGMVNLANRATDALDNLFGMEHQPSLSPEQLDAKIAQESAQYAAARQAAGKTGTDWPRIGGNMAASLPLLAAAPAAETAGGALALGAGTGAAAGALQPVTDPNQASQDFWEQKLGQAGMGAVTGGATGMVGNAIARVISPKVSQMAQMLLDRGVTPTPGQLAGGAASTIEQKLTSVPLVGDMIKSAQGRAVSDFNRAVYNEALAPIGETSTAAVGHEGIAEVSSKLSSAYDNLLPKMTFTADPEFNASVAQLRDLASNMPEQQANQFERIVTNKLGARLGPQGTMDGQTLKGLQSELTQQASGYLSDPSFDNRQLGTAIAQLNSNIRDALARNNPEFADQLNAINQGYAVYTRIRNAGSSLGAAEGVFTPAQLLNAVKAGDSSVGKGAFARGDALLQDLAESGKSVLGTKVADSGTVGRGLTAAAFGALLGHGTLSPPMLAGGAMASLPYTPIGQKLAALLMTQRPDFAAPVASAVTRATPSAAALANALRAQPAVIGGQ